MLRLYYCRIDDYPEEFLNCFDRTSCQERLFLQKEDRLRFLCGRMLARTLISHLCGLPKEEILFAAAPGGKPFVQNASVYFNISHSGRLVACAGGDLPVGIDLQLLRRISPALSRGVGSPEERIRLFGSNVPHEEAIRRVNADVSLLTDWHRLWCGKEALGKYYGSGLSRQLLKSDLRQELEKNKLILTELSLEEGYVGAVVSKETVGEVRRIFPNAE